MGQPRRVENVLFRVWVCVDQPDLLLDVSHADGVKSCANEKVIEASGKKVFVEEELEEKPDDDDASVKPDGVEAKHGEDERDGAKLEGAVEEKDRSKAEKPPDLLARTESMSSSIHQKTFYPRPHQEEQGPKSSRVLEGRRMAIRFEEEDEELENILEVSIEEPLCYPDLAGQDGPVVLSIGNRNYIVNIC